jgi:IS5 family transposase
MLADTLGRPLRFRITAGQAHDITAAADLLEGQAAKAILADKAYDSNDLRERIAGMKAEAVIPSKRNRKVFIPPRQSHLQASQSDRTMLRPHEALQALRHPLRSSNHPLHRLRSPRRRLDLATMNVDPT